MPISPVMPVTGLSRTWPSARSDEEIRDLYKRNKRPGDPSSSRPFQAAAAGCGLPLSAKAALQAAARIAEKALKNDGGTGEAGEAFARLVKEPGGCAVYGSNQRLRSQLALNGLFLDAGV
ncbi:hypothetical protein [Paenibacillus humicola]|uniref:hypothetical protein n=1 Tax=Paenibacillus humicola TaxID=3110540 RepID=UPI00237C3BE3|nr:hypothetical protein [Paenibacillus humicola]